MVRVAIDVRRDDKTGRFDITGSLLVRLEGKDVSESEISVGNRILKDAMNGISTPGNDPREGVEVR